MKKTTLRVSKRPAPKSSGTAAETSAKLNQATGEEFEREGLGVAAKE